MYYYYHHRRRRCRRHHHHLTGFLFPDISPLLGPQVSDCFITRIYDTSCINTWI